MQASVSREEELSLPSRMRGGLNLPRLQASAMFSFCVPSRKCRGLQHGGLSQTWRTCLVGGEPDAIQKANRCASIDSHAPVDRLRIARCPYPVLMMDPIQGWQASPPLDVSTLDRNRRTSLSERGAPINAARRRCSFSASSWGERFVYGPRGMPAMEPIEKGM